MLYPLITLADKLLIPAMWVAKFVLADQIKVEKLKKKLDQQHSNNDDSVKNSIPCVGSTSNSLQNYSDTELKQDVSANDSTVKELDTSYSIDEQLNWLICKLRSMYTTELALNKSHGSLNNSYIICMSTTNKISDITPHQLAMATWLISKDLQLAYEIYKSSVVNGYYGPCVEYNIKRYNL